MSQVRPSGQHHVQDLAWLPQQSHPLPHMPSNKQHGKTRSPSFAQVVKAEVAKISGASSSSAQDAAQPMPAPDMDLDTPVVSENTSAEELQVQLTRLDKLILSLESLPADPTVKELIEDKKAERALARATLRSLKPLKTQLRAAMEARDRAIKKHTSLSEEVSDLKALLAAKQESLNASAQEVQNLVAEADRVATLHKEESLATMRAAEEAEASQEEESVGSMPQQWTTALVGAMPPALAAEFSHWFMTYQQAGAQTEQQDHASGSAPVTPQRLTHVPGSPQLPPASPHTPHVAQQEAATPLGNQSQGPAESKPSFGPSVRPFRAGRMAAAACPYAQTIEETGLGQADSSQDVQEDAV